MTSRRFFSVLLVLAGLFALVMALLPDPPAIPDEPTDKVQHITAFVVLTGLAFGAFSKTPAWRLILVLIAFGGAIELLQLIPSLHRDSDWYDWYADIAAVLGGAAVTLLLRRLLFRR